MVWNYLYNPKLQRLHRWRLRKDNLRHTTLYNGYNWLSVLGLKLIHVSERGTGIIQYSPCIPPTVLFSLFGVWPLQWLHSGRDGVSNHRRLIVYSTVCSGTDQRKHQSSASLALVRGIHRWLMNSPHKGPITRKMFPFDRINSVLTAVMGVGWLLIFTMVT